MKDLIRAHAGLLFAGVATFVMMGAGQALFGPVLPVYVRDFALSEGEAGLFVALLWVGCFLGVGLMYFRGASIGPRHALVAMILGAGGMAARWGCWVVCFFFGNRHVCARCKVCPTPESAVISDVPHHFAAAHRSHPKTGDYNHT